MSWQFLILLNALCIGVAMVVMRALMRQKRFSKASFGSNAVQYIFLWLVGMVAIPLLGPVHFHVLAQYNWRLIIIGLSFMLSNVAVIKSLSYVDAAFGSILNTLNVLSTALSAALILHEDLTPLQIVGGLCLLSAVSYTLLASRRRTARQNRRSFTLGFWYAVVAALFYAVAITSEKSLLGHISAANYLAFGWTYQVLASVLAALIVRPGDFRLLFQPAALRLCAAAGVLRGVGGAAFVLAEMRSNNVALVSVIANFKLVVVVLVATLWLHEYDHLKQKYIGSAAALASLTLLFWK
jgi:drug/metabolite transporter (DMT)-like permease